MRPPQQMCFPTLGSSPTSHADPAHPSLKLARSLWWGNYWTRKPQEPNLNPFSKSLSEVNLKSDSSEVTSVSRVDTSKICIRRYSCKRNVTISDSQLVLPEQLPAPVAPQDTALCSQRGQEQAPTVAGDMGSSAHAARLSGQCSPERHLQGIQATRVFHLSTPIPLWLDQTCIWAHHHLAAAGLPSCSFSYHRKAWLSLERREGKPEDLAAFKRRQPRLYFIISHNPFLHKPPYLSKVISWGGKVQPGPAPLCCTSQLVAPIPACQCLLL